MSDRELLEQLLNELKEVKETQKAIIEKLEVVDFKCDTNRKKLDDLSLDVKWSEREIRKDIKHLQDTSETLVVVLQGKGLLPKAQ